MERYATRIDDDTLLIEVGDGDLEVGELTDICEIVGGETYTLAEVTPEVVAGLGRD